ncbi:hypothetical protein [Nocardiopsis alkaliphila]|uniref:hypothetical protein n=1 Tax=Nocardiopsis alkaliphila TaxID=225762 RepID=UPI00034C898B|nr:hypothetical protein [Nocardiopsis alkaliphila]
MGAEEQAEALAEQTRQTTRERLSGLDSLPTHEHVMVFDALQQELSGVLGALAQGPQSAR